MHWKEHWREAAVNLDCILVQASRENPVVSRPVFFNRPSGNVSEVFDSVNYTNDCLHQLKNNNGFQC